MEDRKQKEIEHYDRKVEQDFSRPKKSEILGGFNHFDFSYYRFLHSFLKDKCRNKKVLDYGCGTGAHLGWLVKISKEVVGIDLSPKSLEIAQKRLDKERTANKVKLILMDCEKMEFPDNYFDVIFDDGTFPSLDLDNALPEIKRVLKPTGFLIGIETLGHNPLVNLKRKYNKSINKRTSWEVGHIFKMGDIKKVENYFAKKDLYFFYSICWAGFFFLNLPTGKFMLKLFEKIDAFLIFVFPFLKKYSFKIIFIFSKLIK